MPLQERMQNSKSKVIKCKKKKLLLKLSIYPASQGFIVTTVALWAINFPVSPPEKACPDQPVSTLSVLYYSELTDGPDVTPIEHRSAAEAFLDIADG